MFKKLIVLVLLLSGFSIQSSFADIIEFRSSSKGKDGQPIILTGILTKPDGEGPFPAVVLLHGCSGLQHSKDRSEQWSNRLVKWGYVTYQLDSFGPRNVANICTDGMTTGLSMGLARSQDAYDAKDFLANLPYIDRNRIFLIGWSHGGFTVLNVLEKPIPSKNQVNSFKAAVAFYPICTGANLSNLNAPLLILIGESDDWTPAKLCSASMPPEQTKNEVILKIYPGAYHDFDWEGMDETYKDHVLLYDPVATQDAIIQVKSFLGKHLK